MKHQKCIGLLVIMVLLITIFSVGCGNNDKKGPDQAASDTPKKMEWKVSLSEGPESLQDIYIQEVNKALMRKTNGQAELKLFYAGQLGDALQANEMCINGALEFVFADPPNVSNIIPEGQLFFLHFLFSDNMKANHEVISHGKVINEDLKNLYANKGLKLLAVYGCGTTQWTGNRPLRKPADFKGFKMRVMQAPMIIESYKAYGANPTPMPVMEVYSGLQLGMIDGQENPIFFIELMKFYETQKYMTISNHSYMVSGLTCNPDFFNSLSPDLQKAILDSVAECQDFVFEKEQEMNKEALDKFKDKITVITLTPEERNEFKKLALPLQQKYVEMFGGEKGKQMLKDLTAEIAEAEKKYQ